MIKTIKKFIGYIDEKIDIKKFLKFGITGGLNTAVDIGIYMFCLEILKTGVTVAQPTGQIVAMINSYLINKNWTFNKKGNYNKSEIFKFLLVNGGSLIINTVSVYILHDVYGVNKYVCKIPIAVITIIINYFGNKLFVFK